MNVEHFMSVAHSPIRNYVVPGLTSWLIAAPHASGLVRMFTCDREQTESVTPHNHRYDLTSMVLRGTMTNIIWEVSNEPGHDQYAQTDIRKAATGGFDRDETPGKYPWLKWEHREIKYRAGDSWHMDADEFHSVRFGCNSVVIVIEGAIRKAFSTILEPIANGNIVPVGAPVASWMYQREEK